MKIKRVEIREVKFSAPSLFNFLELKGVSTFTISKTYKDL
jgi:hypothetical protein